MGGVGLAPASSTMDWRWVLPRSKLWLPRVPTWMPMIRSARTAGSSSKNPESGGVAPKSSPAVSVIVFGFSERSYFQRAEIAPAPPTPLSGSRLPCQSDTFRNWISTGGLGR